jgi:hypothetical protein
MQSTAQKGNAQAVHKYRFMIKGRPPGPNAFNVQLFVDNVRPTSVTSHFQWTADS